MPLAFAQKQAFSHMENIGHFIILILHIQLRRAKFSPILFWSTYIST